MDGTLKMYKIIWKTVLMKFALKKQDKYRIVRDFENRGDSIVYKTIEGKKIFISKEELYEKLENDGFKIAEYSDEYTTKAYFSIDRESILNRSSNSKVKKKVIKL